MDVILSIIVDIEIVEVFFFFLNESYLIMEFGEFGNFVYQEMQWLFGDKGIQKIN